MMLRRFAFLALATAALAACRDTTAITATSSVAPDTLVAYAMTGTSATLPSALNMVARTTVRIDGTGNFDFGFDIDNTAADTTIDILPVRQLVNVVGGSRSVGFLQTAVPFDSITRAPNGTYRPDTAFTVRPHQAFVVLTNRSAATDICYYFATPRVYGKVVIDSVNFTTRAIYLRQVVNPNCGFRSFLTGIPAN